MHTGIHSQLCMSSTLIASLEDDKSHIICTVASVRRNFLVVKTNFRRGCFKEAQGAFRAIVRRGVFL